jgi:hypothetical protein
MISTRVDYDGSADTTTRVDGGNSVINSHRSQNRCSMPVRKLTTRSRSPADVNDSLQPEVYEQCHDADCAEWRNGDFFTPTASSPYDTHLNGRQAVLMRRSAVDEMNPNASAGLLRRSRSVGPSHDIRTASMDCDVYTRPGERGGLRKKLIRTLSSADRPHGLDFAGRPVRQQERLDSIQIIERTAPINGLQVREKHREQFNSVVTMEKTRAPEITSEQKVEKSRSALRSPSGIQCRITDLEVTRVRARDSLTDSSAAIALRQRPMAFGRRPNGNAVNLWPSESDIRRNRSDESRRSETNFPTYHRVGAERTNHELLAALFIVRLKEEQRFNGRPAVDEELGTAGPGIRRLLTEQELDRLERVLLPTADRYRTPVYYASIVYGGNRSLMAELGQQQQDDAVIDDTKVIDPESIAALQVSDFFAASRASLHQIIHQVFAGAIANADLGKYFALYEKFARIVGKIDDHRGHPRAAVYEMLSLFLAD